MVSARLISNTVGNGWTNSARIRPGLRPNQAHLGNIINTAINDRRYEIAQVGKAQNCRFFDRELFNPSYLNKINETLELLQTVGREQHKTDLIKTADRLKNRQIVLILPLKDISVLDVEWDESAKDGIKWQAGYFDKEKNAICVAKKTFEELTVSQLAALLNEIEGLHVGKAHGLLLDEGTLIVEKTTPKDEIPIYLYEKLDFLALTSLKNKEFSMPTQYFKTPYVPSTRLNDFVKEATVGKDTVTRKANAILDALINKFGITYSKDVPGDRNAAQVFDDIFDNGENKALACHEFTILMVTALRLANIPASYGILNQHQGHEYHVVAIWQKENQEITLFDVRQIFNSRNERYFFRTLSDHEATAIHVHQAANHFPLDNKRIKTRRRIVAVLPDHLMPILQLGIDLYISNRCGEALLYYKKALELDPEMVDVWVWIANIYLGKNMLDKAEKYCRKALSLNDNSAAAHAGLGLLFARKKEHEKAITQFRKAFLIDQTTLSSYIYLEMGNCLKATNRPKEAVYYYTETLRIDPSRKEEQAQLKEVAPYVYPFIANEDLRQFVEKTIRNKKTSADRHQALTDAMNRIGIIKTEASQITGERKVRTAIDIFFTRNSEGKMTMDQYESTILFVTLFRLAGIKTSPAIIHQKKTDDYLAYAFAPPDKDRERICRKGDTITPYSGGFYWTLDKIDPDIKHIIPDDEFINLYHANLLLKSEISGKK